MKKIFFTMIALIGLSSCGTTTFSISSNDESLSALTQITDAEEQCIDPWGGDNGENLFFAVKDKDSYYYNIYKKENVFSGSMSQKTSGENYNLSPSYCIATDKLAFSCLNEGSQTSDIYIMSGTKGKSLTQITESANAYENNPCISKDGKIIIYDKSYDPHDLTNHEIWSKNLQTGENILISKGRQPSLSPNGDKIAYVKNTSDTKSCCIWIMDLDGSNQIQITDAKMGYANSPNWSPEGDKIVFQAMKKDKNDYDIYTINVNGENVTQLTKNKSSDLTPYWTTDNYIYFASDRGNKSANYQIWRFKIDE